jgi:hypothetical protein
MPEHVKVAPPSVDSAPELRSVYCRTPSRKYSFKKKKSKLGETDRR